MSNEAWESELDSMKLGDEARKLAWEARARITWGEQREPVHQWLVEQRVDRFAASMIVEACLRERGQSVRQQARRDLIRGLPLAIVSTAAMIALLYFVGGLRPRLFGLLFMVCAGGMIAGLRWTVLGIERLVAGASTPGAVSDLED